MLVRRRGSDEDAMHSKEAAEGDGHGDEDDCKSGCLGAVPSTQGKRDCPQYDLILC